MRKLLAVALGATMLGGCATAIRGTTNQVHFTSEPSGAVVTTSLGHSCTAPCTMPMDRNKEFQVTFTRDGFQPAIIDVKTTVSREGGTSFAGNLLLGGLVGMGVDAVSGAALDHTPNPVIGRLAAIIPVPAVQVPARERQRARPRARVPVAGLPGAFAAAGPATPTIVAATTAPVPVGQRP
ncbi:translation initiation factor 2 [Phreatobacter stygius]|uniref:Translation initiation factor 2 n=1 Tax=Phreatobacter stygius TaxID=1940610 RepID=A0A4D7B103_9HYPH|nr:translation initiation factor 2 [Phreatobacter stygius]QCI63146.1 translation initiation factor 2 [Phreatobacter stygius]